MKRIAMTFALLAALAGAESLSAQTRRYKLIDLGTLGGPNSAQVVESPTVNNPGDVVGMSETSTPDPNCPGCFLSHAFRWHKSVMTDLGTLLGGSGSGAFGTNDRGETFGLSDNGVLDPLFGVPELRAVVWKKDGQIIDLGTLGGGSSVVNDMHGINNRGEVVGGSTNDVPDPFFGIGIQVRAFLWQNGTMQDLGTLGGPDAFASAINDQGQVIGVSYPDFTPNLAGFDFCLPVLTTHPFLWERGKMVDLGTLGGTCAVSAALNSRRQVAGTSVLAGDEIFHPFLWDNGILRDLGTLGGTYGNASLLNDPGDIAGVAQLPGDELHHAFFWRKGVMSDLGTIGDDPCSVAHGMNIGGQVVGTSTDCFGTELHGFVWQPGGSMIDLNSFVPPDSDLIVVDGETINDRGEIAGDGLLPNGDFHAVLLIPCGEGANYDEGCLDATARASSTAQGRLALNSRTPTNALRPEVLPTLGTGHLRWYRSSRHGEPKN
jgi:probable HAF family extracellular repeat protein